MIKDLKNDEKIKSFSISYLSDIVNSLSQINMDDVNISIWKRELDQSLIQSSEILLTQNPELAFSEVVGPDESRKLLLDQLGEFSNISPLVDDISNITKIFCDLFKINRVWLRLDAIDSPMCPRFHTDNVKCRLVTTYYGPGTQWLPNNLADSAKLGPGNNGLADEESGLYFDEADIEQLNIGDVALLKGEGWKGNEGNGLIHRSPHSDQKYKRLYLTIDFVELYLKIHQNRLQNSML